MKNPTFKIGDWVEVKAVISFYYDEGGKRVVGKYKKTRIGQIIGVKKRQLGIVSKKYYNEQAQLNVSKVITVWQIKTGYINKPIEALEEDIKALWEYDAFLKERKLPWFYRSETMLWSERDKEWLRDYMKDWPRDEKGRWIKKERSKQ